LQIYSVQIIEIQNGLKIKDSKYHISHDDGTMYVASAFQKTWGSNFGKLAEKGRFYLSNPN
tara:strand:+ start:1093 stop:1275 length:183 start_codon:yes stop_codon:yes gene_type:complete